MTDWQSIDEAPKNSEVLLAAWIVPSDEAFKNGSRAFWNYAVGRFIHEGCWSGVLGGKPSHFSYITAPDRIPLKAA